MNNNLLTGIIGSFFVIIVVILSLIYFHCTTSEEIEIIFHVEEGQNYTIVAEELKEQKIIKNEKKFINTAINEEAILYANSYKINNTMTNEEIIEILNSPTSNYQSDFSILIYEGEQITEIAENVSVLTGMTTEEVLNYWSDDKVLKSFIDKYEILTDEILDDNILYPLEGYFHPATYTYSSKPTIEEVTTDFLDENEKYLVEIGYEPYKSYHELLTLSSIVERETLYSEDKPIVAGVFNNRLELEMPLQSDITVLYAINEQKTQVTYEDLKVDSPYNTYLDTGLTPGPIANPSIETIEATKNFTDTDYVYFFALQDTGKIIFSETYEEHLKVSEENAWDFE